EVGACELIASFLRAHASLRDHAANLRVRLLRGREQYELEPIAGGELGADDELEAALAPLLVVSKRFVSPHHSRHRTFIRNRKRRVSHRARLRSELLRPRRSSQEREIADAVKLGVGHRKSYHKNTKKKFRIKKIKRYT